MVPLKYVLVVVPAVAMLVAAGHEIFQFGLDCRKIALSLEREYRMMRFYFVMTAWACFSLKNESNLMKSRSIDLMPMWCCIAA
ncbi:hypothetical protein ACVBEF_15765 [Glaciimonas sp. GG7]